MDDIYEDSILQSNQLLTIFAADDMELKLLEELAMIQDEIKELRTKRLSHIKRDIQGLLDEQEEEDECCAGSGGSQLTDVESEIVVLQDGITTAQQRLVNTEEECHQLAGVLSKSVAQQKELRQKREQIKHDASVSLPKAKYDVNLYSTISNIRWRHDCRAGEVSGYVCQKNGVKPFSVDTKQVSHFFLVNYLWDLMDSGE